VLIELTRQLFDGSFSRKGVFRTCAL